MRNPCFNPLAYLDSSCDGCQFTSICECDLQIINGKRASTQKKVKPAPEVISAPVVEIKKEVEKPVKKKVLRKVAKVVEFDLDI